MKPDKVPEITARKLKTFALICIAYFATLAIGGMSAIAGLAYAAYVIL